MDVGLEIARGLGRAFWIAVLILLGVELTLHSDAVVQRYRSVFAVGRAMDKLQFIETRPPRVLFIGNSRTDNGIDPRAVSQALGQPAAYSFNLGLPGTNLLTWHGMIERLNRQRLLGAGGIHTVVLGLDESALQDDNSLGYVCFFADRATLWQNGRYHDWLGSVVRLWSYSGNLRQLREPEKALRFLAASTRQIEPVGGAAATHLGYRAGFGAAQDQAQVDRQEDAAHQPPSPATLAFLWRMLDQLQAQGVRVFVTIPPLRDRDSAFYDAAGSAAPYRALLTRMQQRGVTVLAAPRGYVPADFINAGHLRDAGAQRYSADVGRQLQALGVK
ncbi:hypothetical protein [Thiobacillus sp.]|uniref:hypothetical protein n=1 Tax=Thiobacillus sp. TaxID=924 RepID=UPI00286DEC44|nr:hypothetical protein [Thiobacillus sp.]